MSFVLIKFQNSLSNFFWCAQVFSTVVLLPQVRQMVNTYYLCDSALTVKLTKQAYKVFFFFQVF